MTGLRAGWTRHSIPAHPGSADFANGIRKFLRHVFGYLCLTRYGHRPRAALRRRLRAASYPTPRDTTLLAYGLPPNSKN